MIDVVVYEVRPRADRQGVDLLSAALPFGRLWYADADAAASYAQFYSRGKQVEIQFYNERGELVETRIESSAFTEP